MKKLFTLAILLLCTVVSNAQLNDKEIADNLVKKNKNEIGLTESDLSSYLVSNSYFDKTSQLRLVYLQQSFRNLRLYNQLLVLAFKDEQLVSKTGRFLTGLEKLTGRATATPGITAMEALITVLKDRHITYHSDPLVISSDVNGHNITFNDMGIAREPITAELMWVPVNEGKSVQLAWQIYVIPNTTPDYWMIRVNAINNTIIGVDNLTVSCNWDDPNNKLPLTDKSKDLANSIFGLNWNSGVQSNESENSGSPNLINNATYRVIPFPAESPIHPGGAHALVTNPWTAATGNATSLKWHNDGTLDYNYTRGNNVWAQEDRNGNNGTGLPANSTSSVDPLSFDFTPNYTVTPTQTTPNPNQQFATTNLFYWNNIVHDIIYQYGFDEVSGNFQASNQGRGGLGNDYVLADAQDGSGTNNANFATPADGSSGRMQMYLWSGNPQKDGDLDNGVVSHEFSHGLSNRLTGGPAQAGCLQNAEQMGEGWSDYYALMYTQNWTTATLTTGFSTPRSVGTYAIGQTVNGAGIRSQKYCTNFAVNNKVYGVTIPAESHDRGEIWCATLWDMTWNIINQEGSINPNLYDANGGGGNTIAMKLVTMGMKLQPCSPGFIDGRDAILQADQLLYNGVHQCAIWEAFRRRGMGANALQGSSDNVTDQTPDYTIGRASLQLTQSVTQVPEGQNVTYYNTVSTTSCGGVTNFLLTDTLPTNVTYVSGGTYNAANRVVSFTVTQAAGSTQVYAFTVLVNNGAYFPTTTLFEDNVNGSTINTSLWTATNTVTRGFWSVSTARSYSPSNAYFLNNIDTTSDQRLTLTTPITLPANPPYLTFRHWFNSESTYDGGVLEASTDGGATWADMQANIVQGGYIATMDATTLLNGRQAWSGTSNNKFIKTKVNLLPYANQNLKFRFRFTSDVGTNLEGWYLDDIAIKSQAVVEITSNLFTGTGVRIGTSDTFTIILPVNACTAATISTQPSNSNACVGSSVTFSTSAAGTSNIYQWQVSTDGGATWNNIAGANGTSYTVSNTTATMNNYKYRVIVSNACPSSVTSDAVTLTVSTPAAITTQPAAQTTCINVTTLFSVAASGSGLTYQWQISTDGGATFSNITGATSSSYSISGPTASLNNNQYHVIVTGCNGPVTSSNVILTVNSPAAITTQPNSTSACAGNNASFSTAATGTGISYQWQISTDGGVSWNNINGETNATLNINSVTASMNNNQYHVIVTGSACPGSVTSGNATLTVSDNAVIVSQPADLSACAGNNANFNVSATGSGLTYQWQISTDGGASWNNISGATNSNYVINGITSAQDGQKFRVLIGSACSATAVQSTSATLHVLANAQIATQPSNVAVCANGNASFSISASGNNISYQWQISTNGGTSYTDISGATSNSFNIANVTVANNNNRYRVIITSNPCGTVTSSAATLTVSTPASITTQPSNASGCENTNVNLTVAASGTSLSYQWQVSTDGGTTFTNISGATSATLNLNNVSSSMNNNRYRVIVTEATCGSVNSNAVTLTVNSIPVVTLTANPGSTVMAGQTITLTASSGAGSIFGWYLNGVSVPNQTGATISVNGNSLGNYQATYTDANGCSGTSNLINVRDTIVSYTFIYPNPNRGHFFVRFEGVPYNGTPRTVTMYDAKGARVYQKNYTISSNYQPMEVNAEKFSIGTYAIVLTDAAGEVLATGKVVIQ